MIRILKQAGVGFLLCVNSKNTGALASADAKASSVFLEYRGKNAAIKSKSSVITRKQAFSRIKWL